MERTKIVQRVRALTRDFSNSIFREQDIIDFINEGIDRIKQIIPELQSMTYLLTSQQEPILLPTQYTHLLAIYATARCFGQDERHYQASTHMNEFEVKLEELKTAIENGEVIIRDSNGNAVTNELPVDYVNLKPYWGEGKTKKDIDEGVEGVM